jgi:hypothetical protein
MGIEALAGLVASLAVGWIFFWLSSRQLKNQNDRLEELINTLSRQVEDPRLKPHRDPMGRTTKGGRRDLDLGGGQPAPEGTLTAEKNPEP